MSAVPAPERQPAGWHADAEWAKIEIAAPRLCPDMARARLAIVCAVALDRLRNRSPDILDMDGADAACMASEEGDGIGASPGDVPGVGSDLQYVFGNCREHRFGLEIGRAHV